MKLKDIALIINADLVGDEDYDILNIATLPSEANDNEIAFVFPYRFTKAKKYLADNKAKTLIIPKLLNEDKMFQEFLSDKSFNLLLVNRPKFAMSKLLPHFINGRSEPSKIHSTAVIDETAKIADGVKIGALCYIGPNVEIGAGTIIHARVTVNANSSLGENCLIHSGVVIEDDSVIGNRVEIQANAVIGSDGYSYSTEEATNLEKMQKGDFSFNMDRQVQHKVLSAGHVVIEDDVEIGANTCIDRATLSTTKVGQGSKIDNLCQIAHNVQIGKDCLIIAQTGIAGSAEIQDRVTIAGSCGIGDGVKIGNDVVVGAFSAVNSDLDPFLPVLGIPAVPYGEYMKRHRCLMKLPKMSDDLRRLKNQARVS